MAIAFRSAATGGTDPTTTTTITIPSDVVAGDILVVAATNRDADASPTVVDDDSGGNTWLEIKRQAAGTNGSGSAWWKRATSGTASKTITIDGMTDSMAAGVAVWSGCLSSGTPYAQVFGEAHASADETNNAIANTFAMHPGAQGVFTIHNTANDVANVSSGTLSTNAGLSTSTFTEHFDHLSAGGNDCQCSLSSGKLVDATTSRAELFNTIAWSQTNGTAASIFFVLLPESPSESIYLVSSSGSNNSAATTSLSVVIPSNVTTDDVLILSITNRDADADPAVSDTGLGNIWEKMTRQAANTNGSGSIWWKRATSGSDGATISATGLTGSCSATLAVFRGCKSFGNPYENVSGEANASADESHASITPTVNGNMVCLAIFNTGDDARNVVTIACTDPGSMTDHIRSTSSGGTDCVTDFACKYQATAAATNTFTWAQTNGTGASVAFNLLPDTGTDDIFRVGNITGPSGAGSNAHTGVGFTPGATIFFANEKTATGATNGDSIMSIAVLDANGSSVNIGMRSDDAAATMLTSRFFDTDPTLSQNVDASDTIETYFDWVSTDSNGWTLNWTSTSLLKVGYMAFKSTIQNKVGVFASGTSATNVAVTGVGFVPDVVLFFASRGDTTEGGTSFALIGVGAMTSTAQYTTTLIDEDNITTSRVRRRAYTDKCISLINSNPNALYMDASYVSMDADGFTVAIGTAPGASTNIGYLALKGIEAFPGFIQERATAGSQAYTGFGFLPEAVLFMGGSAAAIDGTLEAGFQFDIGASDGTFARSMACCSADSSADALTARHYSEVYPHIRISTTDGSLTVSANITSFDSDGMTLDFDDAASAQYQGIIAFAPETPLGHPIRKRLGGVPFVAHQAGVW